MTKMNREEIILNLYNHLLEYRDYEKLLFEKDHSYTGIVTKKNLKEALASEGNIATCALLKDKTEVSNTLIAGSCSINATLRENQFESYFQGKTLNSYIVSMIAGADLNQEEEDIKFTPKDLICALPPPPNSETFLVEPIFSCRSSRVHDSERLLFEVLHHLKINDKDSFDEVILITERIPCKSCTAIIIEFIKKHQLKVTIFYWLDTGTKNEMREIEKISSHIKKHKKAAKFISLMEIISKNAGNIAYIDRNQKFEHQINRAS
ncbi:deaminase domain-containing protein [Pantoea sp.]|uniref:deaminase domain-containing protein n=1 Tax=Pantoea sp. TaxID=69393 RepID=UPI0028B23D32|nr:deaminase domain-containing protein [Pantoea sp.]